MAHILLLRLSGPMQSWGVISRFSRRDTGKEPSKSGVIGLLCAAMGISRNEANVTNPTFKTLTGLKMGVRVLRRGILQNDYHTAQNIAKADGGIKDTELSTRWYLADADFVVALEGEDRELLNTANAALKKPKWQLFLGRKAFVPSLPVYQSENGNTFQGGAGLKAFLRSAELTGQLEQSRDWFRAKEFDQNQRLVIEDNENGTEVRQDVPLSFSERRFTVRRVRTEFMDMKNGGNNDDGDLSNKNDSESALSEGEA